MKALVSIMSYPEACRNGMNQALRDTWLPDLQYDYKFFVSGPCSQPDEVNTGTPDDYWQYWLNFREAVRYAVAHDYDYLFHCDRDTYVRPENFQLSRFEHYDYLGYPLWVVDCPTVYASIGAGCWFSRKAMEVLKNAERAHLHSDVTAGIHLANAGIPLWHDPRYFLFYEPGLITRTSGYVSMHLSKGTFDYSPQWMYDLHKEWYDSRL